MTRLSVALAFLAASTTLVAAQQSAVPVLDPQDQEECSGCYLLADVAAIVFGNVQTVTDVRSVFVGQSPNGTNITSVTTVISGSATVGGGQLSYNPLETTGPARPPIQFNDYNDESTIEINGATLTSPTQYEVFTAYSITSLSRVNGKCSTVEGAAIALSKASSYVLSGDPDDTYLTELQKSFIDGIGLTCSAAGGNVESLVQSMVSRSTQQVTSAGVHRPTPVAASTGGSSSNPTAPLTTGPATETSSTTVVFGNSTGVGGSGTGSNPTYAPISPGMASGLEIKWVLAMVAAAGVGAIML